MIGSHGMEPFFGSTISSSVVERPQKAPKKKSQEHPPNHQSKCDYNFNLKHLRHQSSQRSLKFEALDKVTELSKNNKLQKASSGSKGLGSSPLPSADSKAAFSTSGPNPAILAIWASLGGALDDRILTEARKTLQNPKTTAKHHIVF